MHLGSLNSTQEARGALGCTSSNSYTSLMLCKYCVHPELKYMHTKHESIIYCQRASGLLYETSAVSPFAVFLHNTKLSKAIFENNVVGNWIIA